MDKTIGILRVLVAIVSFDVIVGTFKTTKNISTWSINGLIERREISG